MDAVEEHDVSVRSLLAERIADYVRRHNLCIPHGGSVNRVEDLKKRAFYSVSFALPRDLDASIGVYSEKFLLVKFQTRIKYLPPRGRMVFKKESDLYEFLDAAFVKFDEPRAIQALQKST